MRKRKIAPLPWTTNYSRESNNTFNGLFQQTQFSRESVGFPEREFQCANTNIHGQKGIATFIAFQIHIFFQILSDYFVFIL